MGRRCCLRWDAYLPIHTHVLNASVNFFPFLMLSPLLFHLSQVLSCYFIEAAACSADSHSESPPHKKTSRVCIKSIKLLDFPGVKMTSKAPIDLTEEEEELPQILYIDEESEDQYRVMWRIMKSGIHPNDSWEPKAIASTKTLRDWEETKASRERYRELRAQDLSKSRYRNSALTSLTLVSKALKFDTRYCKRLSMMQKSKLQDSIPLQNLEKSIQTMPRKPQSALGLSHPNGLNTSHPSRRPRKRSSAIVEVPPLIKSKQNLF